MNVSTTQVWFWPTGQVGRVVPGERQHPVGDITQDPAPLGSAGPGGAVGQEQQLERAVHPQVDAGLRDIPPAPQPSGARPGRPGGVHIGRHQDRQGQGVEVRPAHLDAGGVDHLQVLGDHRGRHHLEHDPVLDPQFDDLETAPIQLRVVPTRVGGDRSDLVLAAVDGDGRVGGGEALSEVVVGEPRLAAGGVRRQLGAGGVHLDRGTRGVGCPRDVSAGPGAEAADFAADQVGQDHRDLARLVHRERHMVQHAPNVTLRRPGRGWFRGIRGIGGALRVVAAGPGTRSSAAADRQVGKRQGGIRMSAPMWAPGWVDLASTDVAAARPFYEQLFGWTSTQTTTATGVVYTEFAKDGERVAGMMPQDADAAAEGLPSVWTTMIFVPDADAVAAQVTAAGGQVLVPPVDVMTQGRMAIIADPSGAIVGVWQPMEHDGAGLYNAPGSLTWNELQSRDLEAALPFYERLFGWRWEADANGYRVAHRDDKPGDTTVAGAMTMPEGVPPEAPSLWLSYFAVEDCDIAVATVPALGGQVFLPPMDMGPGRFAGIVDPAGAMFMVGHFPAASGR